MSEKNIVLNISIDINIPEEDEEYVIANAINDGFELIEKNQVGTVVTAYFQRIRQPKQSGAQL